MSDRFTRLRILSLAAFLLAACASTGGSARDSASPNLPASPIVGLTRALAPTGTETPSSTETPGPTATATATATAPPTATPTLTPTPAVVNPLTGQVVSDPATLDRRPLAIKIAHFPRRVREQQSGLSLADNVWEHYAEGGTTRFTAIFLSQAPERIGNVRSARLIDAILGEAYQGMLVASGSSTGTMNRLRETDFFNRVIAEATGYDGCPILCREEAASATTDKLFTSAPALWELTTALGLNGRQNLAGFAFDARPSPGGVEAATLHLDFQLNNTVAEWRYDPATQTYARWIDTTNLPELTPHVDALNGQALTAANVVVVYVTHVSSNIRETEGGQRYFSYDVLMTGSGPAKLFRDGLMFDLTWTRGDKGLPRFVDAAGNVAPFRPGNTWFDVVTPNSPTRFDAPHGVFYLRFKAPNPFPDATPTP